MPGTPGTTVMPDTLVRQVLISDVSRSKHNNDAAVSQCCLRPPHAAWPLAECNRQPALLSLQPCSLPCIFRRSPAALQPVLQPATTLAAYGHASFKPATLQPRPLQLATCNATAALPIATPHPHPPSPACIRNPPDSGTSGVSQRPGNLLAESITSVL